MIANTGTLMNTTVVQRECVLQIISVNSRLRCGHAEITKSAMEQHTLLTELGKRLDQHLFTNATYDLL